jgi:hypothetical protein
MNDIFPFITMVKKMWKMKLRRLFLIMILPGVTLLNYSCNTAVKPAISNVDKIQQKDDGTIDLQIEKAVCYNDEINPSSNTAEWNVVVSKSGRYKVWVSSATIDTMDLQYNGTVKISIQDNRIDARPKRDKIVLNASNIKYPYYRADSYMGIVYIQDPGEYTIQVISEKVLAQTNTAQSKPELVHTRLVSVFLTPVTQ